MHSLERITALLPWCSSSVYLSATDVHCDHTVHFSAVYGWIVQCSGHPDTKARPPIPSRLFPVPPGREVGYGCANYRRVLQKWSKFAGRRLESLIASSVVRRPFSLRPLSSGVDRPWMRERRRIHRGRGIAPSRFRTGGRLCKYSIAFWTYTFPACRNT